MKNQIILANSSLLTRKAQPAQQRQDITVNQHNEELYISIKNSSESTPAISGLIRETSSSDPRNKDSRILEFQSPPVRGTRRTQADTERNLEGSTTDLVQDSGRFWLQIRHQEKMLCQQKEKMGKKEFYSIIVTRRIGYQTEIQAAKRKVSNLQQQKMDVLQNNQSKDNEIRIAIENLEEERRINRSKRVSALRQLDGQIDEANGHIQSVKPLLDYCTKEDTKVGCSWKPLVVGNGNTLEKGIDRSFVELRDETSRRK